MLFDYSKLKGRIYEVYGSLAAFAEALDVSPAWVSLHLTCDREWSSSGIVAACRLLDIPLEEIHLYFFKLAV